MGVHGVGCACCSPAMHIPLNRVISAVGRGKITEVKAESDAIEPVEPKAKQKDKPPKPLRGLGELTPQSPYQPPLGLFNTGSSAKQTEVPEPEEAEPDIEIPEAEIKETETKKAAEPKKPGELDEAEKEQVEELKKRDAEVVAHENAHLAAAGAYARGGANYSYQAGPDGKRYRIGGHVNIDSGEEATPEATIAKAQVIQRAASAPAEPSGQDNSVAAAASQMEAKARAELNKKSSEKSKEKEKQDGENSLNADSEAKASDPEASDAKESSPSKKASSRNEDALIQRIQQTYGGISIANGRFEAGMRFRSVA